MSAPSLSEQDEREFGELLEAFRRWEGEGPVTVSMPRGEAWVVMSALHLLMRNPSAPLKDVLEKVGRQIQDGVCDSAALYAIAEQGWARAREAAGGTS